MEINEVSCRLFHGARIADFEIIAVPVHETRPTVPAIWRPAFESYVARMQFISNLEDFLKARHTSRLLSLKLQHTGRLKDVSLSRHIGGQEAKRPAARHMDRLRV